MTEISGPNFGQALSRQESVQAIKKLKHTYMALCDEGYPPELLGPLFHSDAVWTSELFGEHKGRDAIEEFFSGVSSSIVFAAHLALNGIINVDGDHASGHWRLLMPCTLVVNGERNSRWMLGEYQEQYIYEAGKWLFKHLDVYMNFNIRYDEGWGLVAAMRPHNEDQTQLTTATTS